MHPSQTDITVPSSPNEGKIFFEEKGGATAFANSFNELLNKVQKLVVSRYLPPENTQRLRHSGTHSHPGAPETYQSGIQKHSSKTTVTFDELINHDLTVVARCISGVRNDMERQFAQMMYTTISSSCEQSGNVIDAREAGSLPAAFARMLETVEFAVKKDGSVSLPQLHIGPAAFDLITKALSDESAEYHQKIEQIKERKIAEALEKETDRKARFLKYGE